MPITFGAVGDIISVCLLIKDLVKCLDESRGSSTEYQAVIRELWSLDRALLQVESLLRPYKQSAELSDLWENANFCAEQCRKCISDYQSKIKKYQRALRGRGTSNLFRDTTAKIRWQVSEKDDLTKFRTEITRLVSLLNMLLVTAGIKLSSFSDEDIHERLKQSDLAHSSSSALQTSLLADLKSHLEENNTLIRESTSAINALGSWFDLYEKYFRIFGAELMSFIHRIWRINSWTYNALISLQARIPAQLDRTWTQEPAMLEDALGRPLKLHLESIDSWEAFEAILEIRFRRLPGHRKIKRKEYALTSNLFDKDVDRTVSFSHCFLPGRHYDMSMVFDTTGAYTSCPACLRDTGKAADARIKCSGCGLWYQRIAETVADVLPVPFPAKTAVPSESPSSKRKREADSEEDDEPKQFRRVRMKCRQRARKNNRHSRAGVEPLSQVAGESTIGCICGAHDDLSLLGDDLHSTPSPDTWLIQCANCRVWQHRSCVGAANGIKPLGGWHCGQCSKMVPLNGVSNIEVEKSTIPSPPLVPRIVNLRPSPSPDYLPPPERSVTPERPSRLSNLNSKGKKRRPRPQASQGDAVLIDFMRELKYPDLMTKVGEVPLSQLDDSDVDDPIEVEGKDQTNGKKGFRMSDKNIALIQLAEDFLPFVNRKDRNDVSKNKHSRPTRPKLLTQPKVPNAAIPTIDFRREGVRHHLNYL